MSDISTRDRFRGCLLGLATGDALGTALEFKQPGAFEPIDDMVGKGPFGLKPGQWTDDTSMALCLAASLIETGGFDPLDQMQRYVRWFREGYMSSTGECFDIGNTTHDALSHFERFGDPFAGSTNPNAAGNGSLMRLAPVPMRYAADSPRGNRPQRRKLQDHPRSTRGGRRVPVLCQPSDRRAERLGQGDAAVAALLPGGGSLGIQLACQEDR